VIDSAVRFFRESFIPHFRPMPYRPGPERSPHP
jgi:hypothetical protein